MKPYYEDDWVTLYHGDCLELADVWTGADVLVTDPPYGRAWRQGEIKENRYVKAMNSASRAGIANDSSTEFRDGALAAWGNKPFVCFGDLMLPPPPGTKLVCVYHKGAANAGLRGAIDGIRRDAEAIYLGGQRSSGIGGRSSVFKFDGAISGSQGITALTGHPHTKPVGLMETLIELSPPGVIADPFAGSGSTLIAARNLGRKVIGVELEERYCEVIVKRLQQQTFDFAAL